MSEQAIHVKLTHQHLQHKGRSLTVTVELHQATLDALETEPRASSGYRYAAKAICAKFRKHAGEKYYADDEHKGTWPSDQPVTIDDIEYRQLDQPPSPRSSQQRAKR